MNGLEPFIRSTFLGVKQTEANSSERDRKVKNAALKKE